jgi:hypothetical protein
MMRRCTVIAAAVVLACAMPLTAGDTKAKKPLGKWSRSVGDIEVKFHFEADTLKCTIMGMGVVIDIDGDYGVSKDGVVFGRVSKVEKKGICAGPKVGELFTFRYQVKDGSLAISNLGPGEDNEAKQLIEGDYKKK